jgi:hypothetical protein
MPSASEYTSGAHHHVAVLLGFVRIHVVDVQRVVVHGDQAEQVVVGLRDRRGGPVLVDGAHLELLQVAAIEVRAAGLACGLVGLECVVAEGRRRRPC